MASPVARTPPEVRLRAAGPADQDAIWPLLLDLHEHEGVPRPGAAIATALLRLLQEPGLGHVLVAEAGGSVVGYAVVVYGYSLEFAGVDAFLDELNVRADLRGLGLGTRLIDAAEAHCRERGVVALHLEVGLSNPRAQDLYARRGFTPHDRRLMTKRLA